MSNEPQTPNTGMLTPDEVVRELRALRARMPLPDPLPTQAVFRRNLLKVDAEFVNASVTAAGLSEVVQKAIGRTDEGLREEIDAVNRWDTAISEMRELLDSTDKANKLRRQKIGLAAVQTLQICTQLVRDDGHSQLAPHVTTMKRLNRLGRARRKTAPTTEPQPQQPTTPVTTPGTPTKTQ